MRAKRQFDVELLHELKYFSHCKKKAKNPNHFCTQNELSKNLKMSLRDVGKTLGQMVEKGIIIHQTYTNENHVKADKFYPARKFSDYQVMKPIRSALANDLKALKDLASKMRKEPAFYKFKVENYIGKSPEEIDGLIKGTEGIIRTRAWRSKISKRGIIFLESFCNIANEALDLCSSVLYAASFDAVFEDNKKNIKLIDELFQQVYDEITEDIEYSIRTLPARQSNEIRANIYMRIKRLYIVNELRRQTSIKN